MPVPHISLRIASPLLVAAATALYVAGCADRTPAGYQGYVEGEFVHVSAAVAGRLDRLQVARGQQVAARAPLFVLDAEPEAALLRQAREQVAAAQAQLDDLKTGKRPPELDVTRAQLAQASAAERRAATQRTRDELQFAAGGIAQAQLDASRTDAEITGARVRELRAQLDVASLPSRGEQIRAQSAQVAAARAAVEQANWKVTQKAVTAPVDAVVIDTLYREGEWVPAGNPIVRLLPPQNRKVRFFVPESVVGSIPLGREVVLHCDGCKDDVRAKVTFVATVAEYTPPVIYSNENRSKLVFMLEAHPVADKAATLHPGQPVAVTLP